MLMDKIHKQPNDEKWMKRNQKSLLNFKKINLFYLNYDPSEGARILCNC